MKPQLIVFDLGRVLVRICDSWDEACIHAGFTRPPGVRFDTPELHDLCIRLDSGDLDARRFAQALSPLVDFTPEQVHAINLAYLRGPYPGANELLHDLHSGGYATACLSNTSDGHWAVMNDPAHPLDYPVHRLTHRFASHLIRARKPDPVIYDHLERETGVARESIIFFDDMEVNITAAKGRGWHAHHVDPKSPNPISFIRSKLRGHGVLAEIEQENEFLPRMNTDEHR